MKFIKTAIFIPKDSNAAISKTNLEIVGKTDKTGTLVRFKPDAEIFKETTEFDFEILKTRLREQAFLNAGIHIQISDERDPDNIICRKFLL